MKELYRNPPATSAWRQRSTWLSCRLVLMGRKRQRPLLEMATDMAGQRSGPERQSLVSLKILIKTGHLANSTCLNQAFHE